MMNTTGRLCSKVPSTSKKAIDCANRIIEFTHFLLAIGYKPEDKGEPVKVAVHTSCAARREMNVHLSGWQLIDGMEKCRAYRS